MSGFIPSKHKEQGLSVKTSSVICDQILHDSVVNGVAETRFGLDGWSVTANTDDCNTPDIVARNMERVVAIGEVETGDTLTDQRAQQWKEFGQSCPRFYLYVPKGTERLAKELIAAHKVECAGLRAFEMNGHLEVRSIYIENPICRDDNHPWWTSAGDED